MALGDAAQPQAVWSHRVVLDAYAFIKGWLIATSLWVGVLLFAVAAYFGVPAVRNGTDAGHVWGLLGMTVLYGFGVALVFAAACLGAGPSFAPGPETMGPRGCLFCCTHSCVLARGQRCGFWLGTCDAVAVGHCWRSVGHWSVGGPQGRPRHQFCNSCRWSIMTRRLHCGVQGSDMSCQLASATRSLSTCCLAARMPSRVAVRVTP